MDHPTDRLDGWKEISGYLRCDIRTCLRWEKDAGLPIHRINTGATRSRVFAYRAELDRWLAGDHEAQKRIARPGRTGRWGIVAAGAGLLAVALMAWMLWPSSPAPVDCRAKGQTLVCFDAKDRELWHLAIDSPVDLAGFLADGDLPLGRPVRHRVVLKDIDGDGRNEVAVFDYDRNPSARAVLLLDHDGEELWAGHPAFDVRYREQSPGSSFRPFQLGVEDIDGDGAREVLALWAHDRFHPGLFEVYAGSGNRVFQYHHTGLLQSFTVVERADRRQILIGGTNNLLGGDAVLVILDARDLQSGLGPPYDVPDDLRSRATELARYVPVNPQRARQLRYLRFPHNDLSRATGTTWMNVYEILADEDGYSVQVDCGSRTPAYFTFDASFNLIGVQAGPDLRKIYEAHLSSGNVNRPLDEFLNAWLRRVQQWDGAGWVPVPIRP